MTRQSKQVLIVRKDLGMRKGKIASQCAHASMKVLLDLMPRNRELPTDGHPVLLHRTLMTPGLAEKNSISTGYWSDTALADWIDGIFTKITVSVDSEEALHAVYQQALRAGLPAAIIQDVGKIEFNGVPTFTAVAIGPAWADEIDPITGKLPLL